MASIAVPRPGVLRRRLASVLSPVITAAATLARPHRAALANLAHMPLTVAGAGCTDFAAFHLAHGWGWLVTGVSLVILEHLIADEQ